MTVKKRVIDCAMMFSGEVGLLSDRQLANLYGYVSSDSYRRSFFRRRYPNGLDKLRVEIESRGISDMIESVLRYGPYPYFEGGWKVLDVATGRVIALVDCSIRKLPPEVRDEARVRLLLGG